jgi:hypothetical protein
VVGETPGASAEHTALSGDTHKYGDTHEYGKNFAARWTQHARSRGKALV